ncbi:bacillithiol system redox-active protein YtxJ [Flavobacterium cellulosilyticum]|uniref:Bacillithiol system redox-active protein YtxJ n=1 Tax=Flavobacterium cellulosilyticum TaxID=2541731 RepID=A0A4R5CJC2_9FLAO|nr:bacillithiol system redox-active protein YtxJ [Flavobacterium cellulosilyticum]TDD97464.1 bacillithiol system redox-active protein YtxJ [Flavobacterium cellulosilyticum]
MSLFSSIFGSSEDLNVSTSKINWIPLTFMGQLDEIIAFSKDKPVFIFKHSTRCSISRFALKQFENEFDTTNNVDAYFLDLLEYRDISNAIASRFNVYHQSPQLVLIKEGKAAYDVSHDAINAEELKGKL